ncbi:hypothetical protein ACFL2A_06555, partial [Thermodesulfobacteriota bacterium]
MKKHFKALNRVKGCFALLLSLLIILAFSGRTYAETLKIKTLEIKGNERISVSTISSYIKSK